MTGILVWSYSLLSTHERCPLQCFVKYVSKELPYVETEPARRGNAVHKALEDFGKGALKQLPPDMPYQKYMDNIKSCDGLKYYEYQVGITRDWKPTSFFAKNVWGRCKLDVAIIDNDNAIIIDWKTGKPWEDPFELKIQALCLSVAHPHIKNIAGFYVWLKDNKYGEVYELNDIDEYKEDVEDRVRKIEQLDWRATKNKLCPWCTFEVCKYYKETRR